jgi:CheY-like chemotaxis protein
MEFLSSPEDRQFTVSKHDESLARTVLIVEDDLLFRASLCELLESLGLDVRPAADAQEAIRALRTTTFDAVITDMDIPGSGSSVLEFAESFRPETPVIILTALPPSRVPTRHAFRRLFKPASVGQIRSALSDAFDGRGSKAGS